MSQTYAIIHTGGKQYQVKEGDILDVELLGVEPKQSVEFKEVLFLSEGDKKLVGAPHVEKALVKGEVLDLVRGPKTISFKYKRRKSSTRRRTGHRQDYSRVKITEVALA
jgi:large subunit ribosomal protein L21